MNETPHDLAVEYGLGILEESDRVAFESHLAECDACTVEVGEVHDSLVDVAERLAVQPPPELRDLVMAATEGRPQQHQTPAVDVTIGRLRDRRVPVWSAVVAVAAALALVVGLSYFGQDPTVEDILAFEDGRTLQLVGIGADTATFTYSVVEQIAVFEAEGLERLNPTQTYELWIITAEVATPAGLFTSSDGAASILVEADLADVIAVGMTIEPTGGSDTPTGDVILLGEI